MARNGVSELMPQELRPYLRYSLGVHALAAAAALRLLSSVSVAPSQVYTIDFVGPSATIQSQNQQAEGEKSAPTAMTTEAGKPPPDAQFDEFGRRKKKHAFVLPRPSLMRGFQASDKEPQKEQQAVTKGPPSSAIAGGEGASSGGGPGAGIATDMPNFPYPWYISQVRSSLWNQWAQRMPHEEGQAVIVFSILPNGSIVDLRAEESSGTSAFDLTAMSAAQDAAPFAPLPRDFHEPFLKIHVTLRSQ